MIIIRCAMARALAIHVDGGGVQALAVG